MAIGTTKDGRHYVYYVKGTIPENPNQTREYFGRGPAAHQKAKERNRALGFGKRVRKTDHGPLFHELAAAYIDAKSFSPNSKKHLEIRLEKNILPHFGNSPAASIKFSDLDDYVKKRRKTVKKRRKTVKKRRKTVKNSTIRRELTDVKAITSWAANQKPPLIPLNPIQGYKSPPNDDEIIPPPTPDESAAIYQAASPHIRRVIILAHFLGLRVGQVELFSIDWNQVNWASKTILVKSADKGGVRSRAVPLHNDLTKALTGWHEADGRPKNGPVIHYHGKPVKKIQTAWAGTLKRAGIERRIRPYDLRHQFITDLIEAGHDYKTVSDIVGSRPETLMRHYQHVTRAAHRRAIADRAPLEMPERPPEKDPP